MGNVAPVISSTGTAPRTVGGIALRSDPARSDHYRARGHVVGVAGDAPGVPPENNAILDFMREPSPNG